MNSIGKLYIDCPEPEKKDAFNAGKELSEDEYVRMLREYSTTIGTGMPRANYNNSRYNVYEIVEDNTTPTYSTASAKIYNIAGKACGIDEIYRIQRTGMGVLIFEIIDSEMEDAFESEFKFWKKDSMNINNDPEIDKNERIRFLPTKNLQFEIDKHMFMLSGCKMYCDYDKLKVALIIQSIKEI
jgi:hypothetical protein